jgi:hypothetical protein
MMAAVACAFVVVESAVSGRFCDSSPGARWSAILPGDQPAGAGDAFCGDFELPARLTCRRCCMVILPPRWWWRQWAVLALDAGLAQRLDALKRPAVVGKPCQQAHFRRNWAFAKIYRFR